MRGRNVHHKHTAVVEPADLCHHAEAVEAAGQFPEDRAPRHRHDSEAGVGKRDAHLVDVPQLHLRLDPTDDREQPPADAAAGPHPALPDLDAGVSGPPGGEFGVVSGQVECQPGIDLPLSEHAFPPADPDEGCVDC